jgi:WD40 repeat protein
VKPVPERTMLHYSRARRVGIVGSGAAPGAELAREAQASHRLNNWKGASSFRPHQHAHARVGHSGTRPMSGSCRLSLLVCPLILGIILSAHAESPGRQEQVHTDIYGDLLPQGALARLGTVRLRHGEAVSAVCFSADGNTLMSASTDGEVHRWDVATGKDLQFMQGRPGQTFCVAFSPDGRLLATSGADRVIRVREVTSGREIQRFTGHRHRLRSIAFSTDGKIIVSADAGLSFRVWEASTAKLIHELVPKDERGQDYRVFEEGDRGYDHVSAVLSPDGNLLAAGCTFSPIWLWDVRSGQLLRRFGANNASASPLAFSPDGKVVAGFNPENQIRLWEAATGRDLGPVGDRQGTVHLLLFSPDGKKLAAASYAAFLWHVAARTCERTHIGQQEGVVSMAFSREGKKLAMGSSNSTIVVSALPDDHILPDLAAHHAGGVQGTFSIDGRTVISTSDDETLQFWDPATGKRLREVTWEHKWYSRFCVSANGKTLARGKNGRVLVQDLVSGRQLSELSLDEELRRGLGLAALTPDGKLIATTSPVKEPRRGLMREPEEMAIDLWDAATGKTLRRVATYKRWRASFMFAPDSRILAGLFTDNLSRDDRHLAPRRLHLWDVTKSRELSQFGQPTDKVGTLAFSPSGRIFACTVNPDNPELRLREVVSGQLIGRVSGPVEFSAGIAFSPDSRVLAFAAPDRTIRLWELVKGKDLGKLAGHHGRVTSVNFSPDGKWLVSGSDDTSLLIWDLTGRIPQAAREVRNVAQRELQACWTELSSSDASRAHRAVWFLSAVPTDAVSVIRGRLGPRSLVDIPHVGGAIKDLDDDKYAIREKARIELEKIGMLAEPALREALARQPSLEARQRIEHLLSKLEDDPAFPAEWLQMLRAVEVLERIGTPEAVELLKTIAKGMHETRLTLEANASLERMRRR